MSNLPLSAGLLISMAIRYDHSFGMDPRFDLNNSYSPETTPSLEDKQIKLIRQMKLAYDANLDSKLEDKQLLEELEGRGYFSPDKELNYRDWATPKALLEAVQLATDKVEKSPDFQLAVSDVNGEGEEKIIFLYDPLSPIDPEDLKLF